MPSKTLSFCLTILCAIGLGCSDPSPQPPPSVAATDESVAVKIGVGAMLTFMQARMNLMHDVARWKWNAEKPISAPEREKQLLDRLAQEAAAMSLDEKAAREFFGAQIEAAKMIQQADFDRWKELGAEKLPGVPDLDTELRPRIDELSRELLNAWGAVHPHLGDANVRALITDLATETLHGEGIDDAVRNTALKPLLKK